MACQDCERLRESVLQLRAENFRLREENAELKRRLTLYENPDVPPSRRMYPARPRLDNRGRRFPGRPCGYPGRTRPFPEPDVVKAPEPKDECERCGHPLGDPHYVDHHIVEEVSNPSPRAVIDFLELGWECDVCGARVAARHPDCPPDGRFGKNLPVQTTLMKYADRLPLQKIGEGLERRYGLSVTPATILDITRRVAAWLRPEYDGVLQRIRGAGVVYVDETGIKVDGRQHWTWAFVTEAETLIAIRRSRGKRVLKEVLGEGFQGTLVCDGWRSYPNFTRRIQRCWAHLLREAKCLAERMEEARPLSEALHGIYSRLNTQPQDRPPPEEAARLAEDGKRTMNEWAGKPYRSEEVRRLAAKIRGGIDHWFTFLTTPGVEPTNNRAERALREHVVQRKIIGTLRNEKGTRIHETIMTVLATWKQQGLNPSKAMADSLTREWAKS